MPTDVDYLLAAIEVSAPRPMPSTFRWEEICAALKVPVDPNGAAVLRLLQRGFVSALAIFDDPCDADFMVTPDGHAYAESLEASRRPNIHVEGSNQVAVAVGGNASQTFTINLKQTMLRLEQLIDENPDLDDDQKTEAKTWARKAAESQWGPAILQTLAQLATGFGGMM